MTSTHISRRQLFQLGALGAGSMAGAVLLPSPANAAQPSAPQTQATPDSVNEALKQLEAWALNETSAGGVPGIAISVVYKDKVIFAKGFGVREMGKPDPVDADTVFQLASLSKPIGSTLMALLESQGHVKWEDKVNSLLPSFEMYEPYVSREVTIRDMYCHRSGLPAHAGDLLEDMGCTREQVLHQLRYQKPASSIRSAYAYTNFGLSAGGFAAAQKLGMPWETASQTLLYTPLGMTSTSSRFDDFMARKNRARGHVKIGNQWVSKYQRNPDAQSPAGGVSSSVSDMAKWMRLQISGGKVDGKQLIPAASLAETRKPHMFVSYNPFTQLPGFYGLGWNVHYDTQGRMQLGHSGAFALGAGTCVQLIPEEELGIIVLTNASPVGVAEGLAASFIDLALYGKDAKAWLPLYKEAFNKMFPALDTLSYPKPPATITPALDKDAYIGSYTNDLFGDIDITAQGESLFIVQGPNKQSSPLTHYNHDTFTYVTQGENAVGASGVIFMIAPDGKASRVEVQNLNGDGQGVFERKAQP